MLRLHYRNFELRQAKRCFRKIGYAIFKTDISADRSTRCVRTNKRQDDAGEEQEAGEVLRQEPGVNSDPTQVSA